MLNTLTIKVVFDRKGLATKELARETRTGLVQLSISVNNHRHFLSTGVHVYQGQFVRGRIANRTDAEELNARIDEMVRQITDLINRCDRRGEKFAAPMLEAIFHTAGKESSWIDWMEKEIKARPLAEGTRKHHYKVLRYLERKGITSTSQMCTETIIRIDQDLRRRKVAGEPMRETSIYGYHKVLRAYTRLAMQVGLLQINPYERFKCAKGHAREREVLTMDELQRIATLETRNLYMQHVRDLFLVQCYTGVAFADLGQIRDQGTDVIRGTRCKSKIEFITVMTEPVRKILKRYRGKLPLMAYDDYRRMIMPLCQAAGITDKRVSTHTGRHTFATTVALEHGVPMEVLQKMLGHTSIRTTQIYAKVRDRMVEAELSKIGQALSF